jgi:hypothetical protein
MLDYVFPGARWRIQDQSIAFEMNVTHLLATKPSHIGSGIDPSGKRIAVKRIVARVGIEFTINLIDRQRCPSVAKHSNHASVGVKGGKAQGLWPIGRMHYFACVVFRACPDEAPRACDVLHGLPQCKIQANACYPNNLTPPARSSVSRRKRAVPACGLLFFLVRRFH